MSANKAAIPNTEERMIRESIFFTETSITSCVQQISKLSAHCRKKCAQRLSNKLRIARMELTELAYRQLQEARDDYTHCLDAQS